MDDQKPSGEDKESEASDENGSDVACEAEEPGSPCSNTPALEDGTCRDSPRSSGSYKRRCALCNGGEWSPQGQCRLVQFDPSSGCPQLNPARCPMLKTSARNSDSSVIGFENSVLPEELFEPSGHCWVHQWCALWSHGVQQVEGTGLINVDKAVFSGISQKCEYCNRMGATIQCHSTGCLRRFHFPCAAASGSFQSMKTLKLLCTEHVGEAFAMEDSSCSLCEKPGDLTDLLFCTSCGLHYHGSCLKITVTPLKRSGWQCLECKVCQICRKPGADSVMMICSACDKGYHTLCLKPAVEDRSSSSWKCKNCCICRICGSHPTHLDPDSQWYENYSLCKKCQEQRSLSELCVHCNKPGSLESMCQCSNCSKFRHKHCAQRSGSLELIEGCLSCSKQEAAEQKDGPDKSSNIQNTALSDCEAKPLDVLTPEEDEPGASDNEAAEAPEMLPNTLLLPAETRISSPLETGPSAQDTKINKSALSEEVPVLVTVEDEDMEVEEEGPSETQMVKPSVPVPPSPSIQTSSMISCVLDRTWADNSVEDTQHMDSGSLDCGAFYHARRTKAVNCNSEQPSALYSEMIVDSGGPYCKAESEAISIDSAMGQEAAGDFSFKVRTHIRCTIIKSDIVNEISNLSQGDTTDSYHGSDVLGSPDAEGGTLSMDMCLQKEDYSLKLCTDSMPETDDSLLYDPSIGKLDGEKPHRRNSPGRSRVKQGRSSSFPGRRRPRGGSGAGTSRGRGRSRLKSTTSSIETLPMVDIESSPSKEEEEEEDDTMQNTVVLFSNTDKFVLMQDMCVVCGSFGRGSEGHLLACSQCSQCYHPYCVNSKITKVMLLKGWRCVECIVCEVCGKATDPSRLLLCDDCDISYHTYCLDPPLHTVPKGGWKCKWCVCCMQCGSVSPGFHAEWQNNYTHCAPCASLVSCPVCHLNYLEGDLLIQCQNCERWLHAVCENLFTEEEVEQAADEGFDCTACQPFIVKPAPPIILPPSPVKIKEPEPQYYRLEGVWLTEAGMAVLRSLTLSPIQKIKKPRRSRLSTGGDLFLDGTDHGTSEERREGDVDCEDQKDGCHNETMECDIKIEPPGTPERELGREMEPGKGNEDSEDVKKKKRKPYRPGIGGFMIRQRKTHTRSKKGHAAFLEAFRESQGQEQVHPDDVPETPTEGGAEPGTIETEEKKKRRGRKKSKLEDMFPAYLQEAFFGKELMELSKQALLAARPMPQKVKNMQNMPCPVSGTTTQSSQSYQPSTAEAFPSSSSALPREDLGNEETKTENPDLPKMENTDIQELLKDVLGATDRDQSMNSSSARIEGISAGGTLNQSQRPFAHGTPLSNLQLDHCPQSGFLDNRDRSGLFSPEHCDTDGSWTPASTPTTPTTEGENDGLSYNQRSLQRWEKDEELGEMSTISPVLYANKNFPNLKKDYPDWSSRCKQIMKLWRKVPAQDKAPYLMRLERTQQPLWIVSKLPANTSETIFVFHSGYCVWISGGTSN